MSCDSILKKDGKKRRRDLRIILLGSEKYSPISLTGWKRKRRALFTVPSFLNFEKSEFLNFYQHPPFAILKLAKVKSDNDK